MKDFALLFFGLIAVGCNFSLEKPENDNASSNDSQIEAESSEENGVVVGKISASSSTSTRVGASANSDIAGGSVVFGANTFTSDAEVTVQSGALMIGNVPSSEGGYPEGSTAAGPSLLISSNQQINPESAMTLELPLYDQMNLTQQNQNIFVLYHVETVIGNFYGVLPRFLIQILVGSISFEYKPSQFVTSISFQAGFAPEPVEESSEIQTQDTVATAVEQSNSGDLDILSITSVSPATISGTQGGQQISISGTKFLAGLKVTIGGQPCVNVILESTESAKCKVPSLPIGTYDIELKLDGESKKKSDGIAYSGTPLTDFAIDPISASYTDDSITVTWTSVSNANSYSWAVNSGNCLDAGGVVQQGEVTSNSVSLTLPTAGSYNFCVTAKDSDNYYTSKTASNNELLFEKYSFQNLILATGKPGVRPGSVQLILSFPSDVRAYDQVFVRRLAGSTPPADCSSGQVATLIEYFPKVLEVTDSDIVIGNDYSYRLCSYDQNGVLKEEATLTTTAGEYRIFATKDTYLCDLDNFAGYSTYYSGVGGSLATLTAGDYICRRSAEHANISANWVSLLKHTNGASADVEFYSRVDDMSSYDLTNFKKPTPETILSNPASLNVASLLAPVSYAPSGSLASQRIMTGADGLPNNCSDWTSASGNIRVGRSDRNTGGDWYSDTTPSGNWRGIYCVTVSDSYSSPAYLHAKPGKNNNEIELIIGFPVSRTSWDQVIIKRKKGRFAPAPDCHDGVSVGAAIPSQSTPVKIVDDTGEANFYSYRACVQDGSSNVLSSIVATAIPSKGEKLFIFQTYGRGAGNMSVAAADSLCQAEADEFRYPGKYRAILSTSVVDAKDRFTLHTTRKILNGRGEIVANNYADMWDCTGSCIDNRIYTPNGELPRTDVLFDVKTGTSSDGTDSGNNCSDWTDGTAGSNFTKGDGRQTNGTWLATSTENCNTQAYLYCMQYDDD